MKLILFLGTLVLVCTNCQDLWARCAPGPEDKKIEWVLTSVSMLKNKACGVISKEGLSAWTDNPKICAAKAGEKISSIMREECCDANYEWCDAEWSAGGKKYKGNGKRLLNPNGNSTF